MSRLIWPCFKGSCLHQPFVCCDSSCVCVQSVFACVLCERCVETCIYIQRVMGL